LGQLDAGIVLNRIQDPMLADGKDLGIRVGTLEGDRVAWPRSIATGTHEKAAKCGRKKQAQTSHPKSTPGSWERERTPVGLPRTYGKIKRGNGF
jgi:hypothetical protein